MQAAPEPASVPSCGCAVRIVERLGGTLARDGAGAVQSFEGELVDELVPADGAASCAPTGADPCPVPCQIRFRAEGIR